MRSSASSRTRSRRVVAPRSRSRLGSTATASSTSPSAWRAKRPASRAWTGSSLGHGQPPKPVRLVVGERLLDLVAGRSSRTGRTARPARRSGGPAARSTSAPSAPAAIGSVGVGAHDDAGGRVDRRASPTRDASPRRRRACGRSVTAPRRRAASTCAPGSSARCQIATSAVGTRGPRVRRRRRRLRGRRARRRSTVTSVTRPSSSRTIDVRDVVVPTAS